MTAPYPKIARQFSTQKPNQQRNVLFNFFIGVILLFVLLGTLSPYLLKVGQQVSNLWHNFKTNITPHKIEAINPLAVSFKDQIQEGVDKSIFEPKDFQEIDPFSEQVTAVNGTVAIFSKQKGLDEQISSLQSLLVKSRIESKKVVRIDLRFNKIVVEYDKVAN